MFVIDPNGKVVYQGAIDDRPTPDPADLAGAHNYLNEALEAAMSGKSSPHASHPSLRLLCQILTHPGAPILHASALREGWGIICGSKRGIVFFKNTSKIACQ